eukprot:TRINITY_DN137_c1_g1_i1.p1 TRINITY_DN137_c1_g1~~TRINITY_DN137_c1_g1_i1.p1  ORF type:complete len:241 (+),score=63.13 TRINITY_DN137_c1_g1_i1:33-725(+)
MAEADTSAVVGEEKVPGHLNKARVYVGNLSWSTTAEELREHMAQAGTVVIADVLTGKDGRSRGCGVVEYESEEQALNAISTLTDTQIAGTERLIFVREDREGKPPPPRQPRAVAGGAGPAGGAPRQRRVTPGYSLYVGNLPYSVSWQDLKDHFRTCGNVIRADVARGRDRRSRGYGTVVFENQEDAQRAIETMHDSDFNGRPIIVHADKFQVPAAEAEAAAAVAADAGVQ